MTNQGDQRRQLLCKCCGDTAPFFGVVDFNKSCLGETCEPRTDAGGVVEYFRCRRCGFLFTNAFDKWTPDDFRKRIYNNEYVLVDPDYLEVRPRANARFVARLFGNFKSLRIVDFGAGSGAMARMLREEGFEAVQSYDPFVQEHATKPAGTFDLVTCFEVIEHSTRPRETWEQMLSLRAADGLVLFSTPLQSPDIERTGVAWAAVAPRNGHVSLHTRQSLRELLKGSGLRMVSTPSGIIHMVLNRVPGFAEHLNIPER